MTKDQMRDELLTHGYDSSQWDSYKTLKSRLAEARRSKRQHYASWKRIFRSVKR